MPAVDSILTRKPGLTGKNFTDETDGTGRHPAGGPDEPAKSDFDQAMRHALDSNPGQQTPGKKPVPPGKQPAAADSPAVEGPSESPTEAAPEPSANAKPTKTDKQLPATDEPAANEDSAVAVPDAFALSDVGEIIPLIFSLPPLPASAAAIAGNNPSPSESSPLASLAGLPVSAGKTLVSTSTPTTDDSALLTPRATAETKPLPIAETPAKTLSSPEIPSADKAALATGKLPLPGMTTDKSTRLEVIPPPATSTPPPELVGNSPGTKIQLETILPEPVASTEPLENLDPAKPTLPLKVVLEPAVAGEAARPMETAGTGVATEAGAMKNGSNQNKLAELDAKVLPGGGASASAEKTLPVQFTSHPVTAPEGRGSDLNFAFNSQHNPMGEEVPITNKMDLPSLADVRARSMDLVHDTVSLHAVRLVESKADVLSVVIKPMAGTELALELRQRDGGVEAHAILQAGDRQWLIQHWPDLQQRLEQRGIKLGLLGGETNTATGDSGNFSQQQSRTPRDEQAHQASAFAEFAAHSGGATARALPVRDGWEWWA